MGDSKEYKYEERIVCFIDILGFSSRIKETEKNPDLLTKTCETLNLMDSFMNNLRKMNPEDMIITQFSDSIVISFPWLRSDRNILKAFLTIKFLQVFVLLQSKLLLRGGIVMGKLIHTEKLLVGPAMIAAYQLESKCAVSPRIVIEPSVARKFSSVQKKVRKEFDRNYETIIHKDFDDTYYIDYFNFSKDEKIFEEEKEMELYFSILYKQLSEKVNHPDITIRMKYFWLRNKIKDSEAFKKIEYKALYRKIVTNKGKQ